jgi:sn-glycerol 3-phosphate transport system ATP-binding protein
VVAGISVENLVKKWGTFRAVDNVSFRTEDAEFVALLGPSGCGKSTTLRLIAGLDEATSGTITIDGRDVTGLVPAKRNLSMVFQSYALFPHLTVADNILFGLSVRGVSKADQQQRLKRTVDLLGLGHLLDRRPSQMSGGQQQRVALGRALISETPVCLLDEPLSNLDAKLRAGMRSEIRSLQKRLGITMVYVTHDQAEAMSMADKVILLNKGRVDQAGVPSDLYEKPASVFVAQFVGTPPMNVLETAAGQHGLTIAGGERVLAAAAPEALLFGIRPEHVRLAETGEAATVQSSEYFGADTILVCRVGEQPLQVRVPGRPGLRIGATVRLAWEPGATHFFDKAGGLRRDDIKPQQTK